jgi:mannosyltransferase OCH1-like enzyme
MIPKIIHYFWFSNDPIPFKLQNCIDSWMQQMPDYEIRKWDTTNVVIDCAFAQRALKDEKWAFLTDYFRFKILFEIGGIYLDSDVYALKSFNSLLIHESFWSSTDFKKVDPFIIGAVPKNSVILECMNKYKSLSLEFTDYPTAPNVIKEIFEKNGYNQDNMNDFSFNQNIIFADEVFCPMPYHKADEKDFKKFAKKRTITIHLWNTAWNDPFTFFWQGRFSSGWKSVWCTFKKNPFQNLKFYKNIFYHLKCQMFNYPQSDKNEK